MKPLRKFLFLDDCFKDAVKKRVPELNDRDDFEAKFLKRVLPCKSCEEGKSDSFFYRFEDRDEWIQVDQPGKCPKCRDQEALKNCQKETLLERGRLIDERLTKEYFKVPEVLKKAGFKNYQETNGVTAGAKEGVICFIRDLMDPKINKYNLLIMGNPGTGKTHLCTAAARTLRKKGFTVGFLTTGQLLTKIKSTYQKGAIKTSEGILNDIKKLDLLILDDVGSEAIGGNDDWRKSMLFEVLESRLGKPTFYTSNLTDTDLPDAIGNRVFSRLYYNTKFIDLFTDDYRRQLQVK